MDIRKIDLFCVQGLQLRGQGGGINQIINNCGIGKVKSYFNQTVMNRNRAELMLNRKQIELKIK